MAFCEVSRRLRHTPPRLLDTGILLSGIALYTAGGSMGAGKPTSAWTNDCSSGSPEASRLSCGSSCSYVPLISTPYDTAAKICVIGWHLDYRIESLYVVARSKL